MTRARRAFGVALGAGAVLAACGGDRSRSPTCGLAQVAGPTLIQQQFTMFPYALTAAPRGLPGSLPARMIGMQQGRVQVAYRNGALALAYDGPAFPAASISDTTAGYALLVVDDSTQRAEGVLVYESRRPPPQYPQLGLLSAGGRTIPVYGVRVAWASVSNPRCPLLGTAALAPR